MRYLFQLNSQPEKWYHCFDDGTVVYDPAEGSTNLFNPIAGWLISTSGTLPFSYSEVEASLLADIEDTTERRNLSKLLKDTLQQLLARELVTRVP